MQKAGFVLQEIRKNGILVRFVASIRPFSKGQSYPLATFKKFVLAIALTYHSGCPGCGWDGVLFAPTTFISEPPSAIGWFPSILLLPIVVFPNGPSCPRAPSRASAALSSTFQPYRWQPQSTSLLTLPQTLTALFDSPMMLPFFQNRYIIFLLQA